jgi:hypothetical protein
MYMRISRERERVRKRERETERERERQRDRVIRVFLSPRVQHRYR